MVHLPGVGGRSRELDGTFSKLIHPFFIRTLTQFHYHFLSNQLFVDAINFCYTFSVIRKRLGHPVKDVPPEPAEGLFSYLPSVFLGPPCLLAVSKTVPSPPIFTVPKGAS
jgi:hypothetical protein